MNMSVNACLELKNEDVYRLRCYFIGKFFQIFCLNGYNISLGYSKQYSTKGILVVWDYFRG